MSTIKTLTVDPDNELWDTHGLFYYEFPSDPNLIRYYTVVIINKAPERMKESNLLEQQVSEIIKNAVYHGNKKDKNKKVKVWYGFTNKQTKVIVEDEGEGFTELENWKQFHEERQKVFDAASDPVAMMEYASFRTPSSTDEDGGNSLFAAVEYWNGGMIYNAKKNKVCVVRHFNDS